MSIKRATRFKERAAAGILSRRTPHRMTLNTASAQKRVIFMLLKFFSSRTPEDHKANTSTFKKELCVCVFLNNRSQGKKRQTVSLLCIVLTNIHCVHIPAEKDKDLCSKYVEIK